MIAQIEDLNFHNNLLVDERSLEEFQGLSSGYPYLIFKGRIPNSAFGQDAADEAFIYSH